MARHGPLKDLTDLQAVERAVDEYETFGRERFLARHNFGESDAYFIEFNGTWFDSKPLLGAAYSFQYPDRPPIAAKDFSGGHKRLGPICERLGLRLVTEASEHPPKLGESFQTRSDIKARFGGELTRGIITFPGCDVVNIFSSEAGPYADDRPSLLEPFSYRGEGLSGNQSLSARGNARLEECRVSREAARFWFQPHNGHFTFESWVTVQARSWVPGRDQAGELRWEIKWFLRPVPSERTRGADSVVEQEFEMQPEPDSRPPVASASGTRERGAASYEDLMRELSERTPNQTSRQIRQYARSEKARRATLLRANGGCENPECGGMAPDTDSSGSAILEVDHIEELSNGGSDHPLNMIALCPNCHAMKTRGARRAHWKKLFSEVVNSRHA